MLPPAVLVMIELARAKIPELTVPVMLPELVTLAKLRSAQIPLSPVMLPPAWLVTAHVGMAKTPMLGPPVMLPELMTLTAPICDDNPEKRRPVMLALTLLITMGSSRWMPLVGAGDRAAGDNIDGDAGLDSGAVATERGRHWCRVRPRPD